MHIIIIIIIIIKGLRPPSDSSNSCLEREVIHCHLHAIMKKKIEKKSLKRGVSFYQQLKCPSNLHCSNLQLFF